MHLAHRSVSKSPSSVLCQSTLSNELALPSAPTWLRSRQSVLDAVTTRHYNTFFLLN